MIYGVAGWGERSKSIPRIYLRWVWASHTLATQLAVSDFTGCGAVSVNWVRNPSVGDVITDWACDEGIHLVLVLLGFGWRYVQPVHRGFCILVAVVGYWARLVWALQQF